MGRHIYILILFLLISQHPVEILAIELTPPGLNERQRQIFKDLNKELNNEIALYGLVSDLEGRPVSDAVVKLTARVAGVSSDQQFPVVEVRTNTTGFFVARTFGELIELKSVEKEGYLYRYQYNRERMFHSAKPEKRHGLGYEPDKPAIFRVRKLAPPAFVVLRNMTFGLKPGRPAMFDMIKRQWIRDEAVIIAMQYSTLERDWHTDIKLSVEGEPGKMNLILEAPDADSGFVIEKHEFFDQMTEAPELGYRQKVEFPVKKGGPSIMAYVKCQGGLFYGKIDVEYSEDRPGIVAINATSFTNLAKGRGLEYIPAVASQYDEEVYGTHTRDLIRRADLLSGKPIEMPKPREKTDAK